MEAERASNLASQAILLSGNEFEEGLSAVKERRNLVFGGD